MLMTSRSEHAPSPEAERASYADRPRRRFLKKAAALSFATAGGTVLLTSGCGEDEDPSIRPDGDVQTPTGEDPKPGLSEPVVDCQSTETLSPQDLKVRQALGYTPDSPEEGQRCDNCRFFTPPPRNTPDAAPSACGGCQLFPGPVVAGGWCTSWAEQQA